MTRLDIERVRTLLLASEMRSRNPWGLVHLGIEAVTLNAFAAASISLDVCALPGWSDPEDSHPESLGTISLSSSSRFPLSSPARLVSPVMFPPGRARLATNPFPTGSRVKRHDDRNRAGCFFAARVAVDHPMTMTSTLRRTSSAASSGSRSSFPSAYRYSITMFFPSM